MKKFIFLICLMFNLKVLCELRVKIEPRDEEQKEQLRKFLSAKPNAKIIVAHYDDDSLIQVTRDEFLKRSKNLSNLEYPLNVILKNRKLIGLNVNFLNHSGETVIKDDDDNKIFYFRLPLTAVECEDNEEYIEELENPGKPGLCMQVGNIAKIEGAQSASSGTGSAASAASASTASGTGTAASSSAKSDKDEKSMQKK